jgi:hypothetical protein
VISPARVARGISDVVRWCCGVVAWEIQSACTVLYSVLYEDSVEGSADWSEAGTAVSRTKGGTTIVQYCTTLYISIKSWNSDTANIETHFDVNQSLTTNRYTSITTRIISAFPQARTTSSSSSSSSWFSLKVPHSLHPICQPQVRSKEHPAPPLQTG